MKKIIFGKSKEIPHIISNSKNNAFLFSKVLKNTKLPNSSLCIGLFKLKGKVCDIGKIQYNHDNFELIQNYHDYCFPIKDGLLNISLQLYENTRNHYRLFAYTKFGDYSGMTFSINLTTEAESKDVIYLTQKINFTEQYNGNKELAKAFRSQKQKVFVDYLRKLGYEITENNEVILGIFDPTKLAFVNTTDESFLNDFLLLSILKGHFQGNKGYQLEILPSFIFDKTSIFTDEYLKINLPQKNLRNKTKRSIPLSMRYKILHRDNFKCVKCGRIVDDGIKLHVDHKLPFSLGGLTEMSNLWTLCNECNLGKSNKYIDM